MKTRVLILSLILSDIAAAVHVMQTSFAGGEISPLVQTRVDSDRYFQSAETLANMICIPQGPAIRRPGTRYVATAPGVGRLLPFPHATDDADVLELTHELMRFYRNTGPILDVNDDPYSIETRFDANDLFGIQTWHSGDIMYLVDGVGPPQKLSRTGHTNWTIEDVPFTGGPYRNENTTPISISTNVEIAEDFADGYIAGSNSHKGLRKQYWAAQTFTPDANYTATHIRLRFRRQYTPGEMLVSIRATDAGEPNGPDLATGRMEVADNVTTDDFGDWYTFDLDEPVELTAAVQYSIVARCPWARQLFVFDSEVHWRKDASGEYAGGAAYYSDNAGVAWTAFSPGDHDFLFAVLGTGDATPEQTVTLTASDDVFDVNHVGALWQLRHSVPAQEYSDTLDANEPGRSLFIGRDAPWTLTTTGTWSGLLLAEASEDAGFSWETIANIEDNVTDYSETQTANALVRVRMSEYQSGACVATLSTIKHLAATEYRITDVNDPCTATATLLSSFGVPGATTRWSEGAWSTYRGWPSVVSSYADRLVFASTDDRPVTIWASKTGEYENFRTGALADDAYAYTLTRTGQDRILWVTTQQRKGLLVGTAADIVELQPTYGTSISPTDPPSLTNNISLPCAPIRPVSAESALLVVQRHGRKIRELMYEYATDSLVSPDLTLYGSHATGLGLTEMAWTMQPHPILWCVRTDGVLAGLTYERNYQVAGWHRHTFTGRVRSAAAIPSPNQDRLWLLTERIVDANTVYHVEYLADWDFHTPDAAYFVDSGLSWAGDPNATRIISSIVRLAHPDNLLQFRVVRVSTTESHGFSPGDRVAIRDCDTSPWMNTSWPVLVDSANRFYLADPEDPNSYYNAYELQFKTYFLPAVPDGPGPTCGAFAREFTGLEHLSGIAVTVVADGNAVGDFVVDPNGAIDINEPALWVHAGLPYTSTLQTIRYDFNGQEGPTWPRRKALPNVLINFLETGAEGVWVGTDSDNLMPVTLDGLYSGDCEMHLPTTYGLGAQLTILQDAPMPMTIRAVVPELEIRR